MKQVRMGIILNGNPNLKQKNPIYSVIEKCLRYIWIILLPTGIVLFLAAIGKNSRTMQSIGLCMVLWSVLLLLVHLLWSPYGRCPHCGHFFTLVRISDDQYAGEYSRNIVRNVDSYHSGYAFDLHGNSAFVTGRSRQKVAGSETLTQYTFNSRCRCCHAVVKIKRYSFTSK